MCSACELCSVRTSLESRGSSPRTNRRANREAEGQPAQAQPCSLGLAGGRCTLCLWPLVRWPAPRGRGTAARAGRRAARAARRSKAVARYVDSVSDTALARREDIPYKAYRFGDYRTFFPSGDKIPRGERTHGHGQKNSQRKRNRVLIIYNNIKITPTLQGPVAWRAPVRPRKVFEPSVRIPWRSGLVLWMRVRARDLLKELLAHRGRI